MSDATNLAFEEIDRQNRDKPAATRRQLVAGAAATLGGMGLLTLPGTASATPLGVKRNTIENIINIAATAEVLATIVNTVGFERRLGGDATTQRNIGAAAREELAHYYQLIALGAKPLTRRIWVPDAVFANRTNFLNTLQVGDQIFVNAYLIATTAFAQFGSPDNARIAAEFMGVEAVHRALARQSLGQLGNDRVFLRFNQREEARDAPNAGQPGFVDIFDAVAQLQGAGFGFGEPGAQPGRFFEFRQVAARTPNPAGLNTFQPA